VAVKQTQKQYKNQNSTYVCMSLKSQVLAGQKCVIIINTDTILITVNENQTVRSLMINCHPISLPWKACLWPWQLNAWPSKKCIFS